MEKMTKREMYEVIAAAAKAGEWDATVILEDVVTFAEKEIAALDKKAAKARERAAEKRAEGDALKAAVAAVLTDEYATIADIAERVEDAEATVAKVTYRLTALVKDGVAEKDEITVEGAEGKKRKVKGYRLAQATEDVVSE